MKARIYYFSGTGNSYRAAERLAQLLGGAELINMRGDPAANPATDADVVGFAFPIYHWTLCEPVQDFIKGLTVNKNAYIFAVSTLAAINGYAFEVLAQLLAQKGAKLHYAAKVYSVANLCIAYPPFPSAKTRVPATERRLARIARDLSARKQNRIAKAGWLTRLIYPKMMPKYRDVQSEVDRGFFANDTCKSCGICAKVCPKCNIVMVNGKPEFLHRCSACMACVAYCPSKAIGYKLPPEQLAAINTPLMRMMGLPEKRKRYHHPMVDWAKLAQDTRTIPADKPE